MALKENCINFVSITKPFIVVDAYPNKFGKNAEPIYVAKGEPTVEQINDIRNFIATQRNLDRSAMPTNTQAPTQPEQVMEPVAATPTYMETMPTQPEFAETPVDANAMYNVNPLAEMPAPAMTEPAPVMPEVNPVTDADDDMDTLPEDFPLLSDEEAEELMSSFIGNIMKGEVDRQVQAIVEEKNAAAKTVEAAVPALDETAATEPVMEAEPAEDDFSLEAIGRALDAEIAKRNGKK